MKNSLLKYLPCLMLTACVSAELESPVEVPDGAELISIRSEIKQVHTRRVEDGGFADGDAIGVYVVNHEGGQPGSLAPDGNHATNVKFTFDEDAYKWDPETPVYWKDKVTPVDAYGYYPYREDIPDVRSMPFTVCSNQSEEDEDSGLGGYEASDFLWAKASGVSPSSGMISLEHNHMMASVMVSLVPGEGFTDEEWAALDKTVMVESTHLASFMDLSTGEVTVDESSGVQPIVAVKDGEDWRAIVVPQTVEKGAALISITVNGFGFHLTRESMMTFHQGKMHKFTIQVQNSIPTGDYQFKILDEAVTVWESELVSHNGTVREYICVHVPEAGQLNKAFEDLCINPSDITRLKLTGYITEADFEYIKEKIPLLEALNLKDVRLVDCGFRYRRYINEIAYESVQVKGYDILPEFCCDGLQNLRSITFPDKLTMIGKKAFYNTQLEGDLIIPEGVTYIGESAFANINIDGTWWNEYSGLVDNHLIGKLVLPSSLRYIGNYAFEKCDFHCDLILPSELEYIGDFAFSGCSNMTGRIMLPKTLKKLCRNSFAFMEKVTGTVVIPDGLTIISESLFFGTSITGVIIPETVTIIGRNAFLRTRLGGDLVIPNSVTDIGEYAFRETAITSVQFSENLYSLGRESFRQCDQLQGIVRIPETLTSIPIGCFSACSKLEGVIMHPDVEHVPSGAFWNCYSLNYLRSEAIKPPVLDGVPYGVPKDNFTVEVPESAVDAYRSAPYWNEFKRISSYRGFVCRPSSANVLNAGGSREIILNADADWTMTSCPEWCHMSAGSGHKKTTLTLTIDPLPHGQGNRFGTIEFKLDDSDEHYTHMTVGQYDYEYEEDEYVPLQKSSKGNGIDIFIVGDGYDAADISTGLYLEDMRQEMEYFFAVEPYKTYRDYFDVHTAIALSYESGIGTLNTLRNVKFETTYGDFDNARINGNSEAVVEYAVETVEEITSDNIHQLTAIVIPNTDLYDGVTTMWTNGTAVAFCPKSSADYPSDARGLIQHEAGGHAFGKLGDEYIYHNGFIQTCKCSCCEHAEGILDAQARGWYRNLSLNGKYKEIEWTHLVFDPRYSDIVDVYEGGYFHRRGVYRSEYNSCMNNNVPYFSTISRQAIVERIMEYAGEEFSFEDFVAKDSREWGIDFTDSAQTRSMTESDLSIPVHRHHPIVIEGSPLD